MSDTSRRLDDELGAYYDASLPPSVYADPQIASLTPTTMSVGAGPTTVTVVGSRFEEGSVVEVNQAAVPTTFVSATELTTDYDPTVAGTVHFTVRNPNDDESNSFPLAVLIEPNESRWMFSSAGVAPTTNGRVSVATGDQSAPGTIWITVADLAGNDQTERALRLVEGSVLRVESSSDPDRFQEYVCRQPPPIVDGVLTIVDPVHWNAGGDPLADGDEVALTGYQLPTGTEVG